MPGVFLQGLLIYDAEGRVLFRRSLSAAAASRCVALADQLQVTLVAYCDERILCAATDEHTNRLLFYKEPTPEAMGDLGAALQQVEAQKLIFLAPQARIDEIRPLVEEQLAGLASITTALSGMLEVLPPGASKGTGVAWLLDHLGVEPGEVMAMGDGENDVEMLKLAGWGVAMANAGQGLKQVASVVVGSNDEGGVAEAIERFVLAPRGIGSSGAA